MYLMASRPSLVTPSGRLRCSVALISLGKDSKVDIEPVGLAEIKEGGKVKNGVVHNSRLLTSPGPAHTTNNFAPNEYRGVVNPSSLVVYKGSNTRDNDSGNRNRK